jgi:hypothetical protein
MVERTCGDPDDEVVASLNRFAEENKLAGGSFKAIGPAVRQQLAPRASHRRYCPLQGESGGLRGDLYHWTLIRIVF